MQPFTLIKTRYVNVIHGGTYNAGVGKGNQNHYIEQHELSVPKNGTFKKKVGWGITLK